MELSGATILVTGGAVRIGRAICIGLAARGCNVIVHYSKSGKEAWRLVSEIRTSNGTASLVRGDLSSEIETMDVLKKASEMHGPVSAIVNNAAVFMDDSLRTRDTGKMLGILKVNLLAPLLLTSCFARMLKAGKRCGCVVNLLDQRVVGPYGRSVSYLLSKRLLAEFTEAAAAEYAPLLRVNGVAPGAVIPPPQCGVATTREKAGRLMLERRPTAGDVAEAVAFLLEAEAVTGQTVYVDAGQHLLRVSPKGI